MPAWHSSSPAPERDAGPALDRALHLSRGVERTTHPQTSPQRSPLATLAETEDVAANLYRSLGTRWDDRHALRIVDVLLSNHRNNRVLLEDLAGRDDLPPARSPSERAETTKILNAVVARAERLVGQRARGQDNEITELEAFERKLLEAYEHEAQPDTGHVSDHAQRILREQVLRRARQNLRVLRLMPRPRDPVTKPGNRGDTPRREGWVDDVADKSFPANDPPPWTGAHA